MPRTIDDLITEHRQREQAAGLVARIEKCELGCAP